MILQFRNSRPVEYRANTRRMTGYAAVFYRENQPGTEYIPWEGHVERIANGAFAAALERGDDVRALFNHDSDQVLGRLSAGTLALAEDDTGLRYEIDLPDTTIGRDVRELVQRGDITGSSFAFRCNEWEDERRDDVMIRTIQSVELVDVGPVTFPAYEGTYVESRSAEALRKTLTAERIATEHKRRMERIDAIAKTIKSA